MVDSIDVPVQRLCIVVNGIDDTVISAVQSIGDGRNPLVERVYIERPFRNIGVAPAWNSIIKSWPECEYWLICNNDTVFQSGELALYHATWKANPSNVIVAPNGGFGCFIIDPSVVSKVGLFDENIWPIYHEDIDYIIRMQRADVSYICIDGNVGEHGNGSWTIRSNADYQSRNQITQQNNSVYVDQKWGPNQSHATPWNQQDLQLWSWQYDPDRRKAHSEVWDHFEHTANRLR
jgi:GT2 family glycosyltransferase